MASKRQNAPSEEADSCQVRSNALGAFERTHGRTQEQGSNACPAGPSSYMRSNACHLRSNAGPVSPHFPCCPSRPYRTSLQPCAVGNYVRSTAHSAFERTCGRTQPLHTNAHSAVMYRKRTSNACSSAFERNSLRSNAPLTWQHILFCL
jgi:hypothetical protein